MVSITSCWLRASRASANPAWTPDVTYLIQHKVVLVSGISTRSGQERQVRTMHGVQIHDKIKYSSAGIKPSHLEGYKKSNKTIAPFHFWMAWVRIGSIVQRFAVIRPVLVMLAMEFVNNSFCQAFFFMLFIFRMISIHSGGMFYSLVHSVDDRHLNMKDL